MNIEFHSLAEQELEDATDFYYAQSQRLGDDFTEEIERVFRELVQHPGIGSSLPGGSRRYNTRRYPYAVIYSVQTELIFVIAVMHQRRKPDYWRNRI